MKFGSLFSGIGGIDLGLERAGMTCIWQSEIDPYASRVLAKHWPNVPNLGDVTKIDWSEVERPDLICGGYPCQPFSLAGARRGTDDPRHLWPHFARALRVLRPEWALLENVPGHLSLGFGDVQADLAELGYDTEWECLPAAAFGAPHLRFRIVVVAHAHGERHGPLQPVRVGRSRGEAGTCHDGEDRSMADTNGGRCKIGAQLDSEAQQDTADRDSRRGHTHGLCDEMADAPVAGLEGRLEPEAQRPTFAKPPSRHERGGWWATEPDVGRVANGIPSRVDRLRALGNAVVPQVAEWVGRQLMKTEFVR